jgi:hypothetical protein
MATALHRVLRASYVGLRLHEAGAVVEHETGDAAGDNLKKLTPAEVAKHKASLGEEPEEQPSGEQST